MAKKIIPLKSKKSSPVKLEYSPRGQSHFLGFNIGERRETELEKQFGIHKQNIIETDVSKNIWAGMANPFAGLSDPMADVEVASEDLTINQKAVEQQRALLDRGFANVLNQYKQSGTGSAQVIASQLTESAAGIGANIGEQERQNVMARVKEQSELDRLKAASKQQLEMKKAEGEFAVQSQIRKGEEDALSRELNKEQALLSLISGEIARQDELIKQERGWLGKILNIF